MSRINIKEYTNEFITLLEKKLIQEVLIFSTVEKNNGYIKKHMTNRMNQHNKSIY